MKEEGPEKEKNGERDPVYWEQRRIFSVSAWLSSDSQCTLRDSFLIKLGTFLFPCLAHFQNTLVLPWPGLPVDQPILTLLHTSSLNYH